MSRISPQPDYNARLASAGRRLGATDHPGERTRGTSVGSVFAAETAAPLSAGQRVQYSRPPHYSGFIPEQASRHAYVGATFGDVARDSLCEALCGSRSMPSPESSASPESVSESNERSGSPVAMAAGAAPAAVRELLDRRRPVVRRAADVARFDERAQPVAVSGYTGHRTFVRDESLGMAPQTAQALLASGALSPSGADSARSGEPDDGSAASALMHVSLPRSLDAAERRAAPWPGLPPAVAGRRLFVVEPRGSAPNALPAPAGLVSGYAGHVADREKSVGRTWGAFTAQPRDLAAQAALAHPTSLVLVRGRDAPPAAHSLDARAPSRVPHYAGHVPGARDYVGLRYGEVSRDVLARQDPPAASSTAGDAMHKVVVSQPL